MTLDDDTPMSLTEAAGTILRGLVKASTLRAAAARRELTVERIGRRYVVTPAAVKAWRRRCRVEAEARTSTSSNEPMESPSGTFEMDANASAQSATDLMLEEQKRRFKRTSQGSTASISGTVIPLTSRSQT